jgi:hypothetical protein
MSANDTAIADFFRRRPKAELRGPISAAFFAADVGYHVPQSIQRPSALN